MALFVGFSFPFRKGETSFPVEATDEDLIKQSLTQLILTGRGERVMRPEVGSNAYRYIFEDNDAVLEQTIQAEVQQVIAKYEPRVALLGVTVTKGDETVEQGDSTIVVTITYIVLLSRSQGTLTISMTGG